MIKLVIFDFDGTIVDSKAIYYNSFKKNITNLSVKQIDELVNKGGQLEHFLNELGFSKLKKWLVKRKIMKDVFKNLDNVRKCRDADAIGKVKTEKILISNSTLDFIIPIVNRLKLMKYFSEIYGGDNFSDKQDFISDYLKKNKLKKDEVMYVGDRIADIKLARNLGIIGAVVSGKCAWNSRKELIEAEPDFIVEDIVDINQIL
ncbi:MAG: HAD-IA family hydrolase [archaeon]